MSENADADTRGRQNGIHYACVPPDGGAYDPQTPDCAGPAASSASATSSERRRPRAGWTGLHGVAVTAVWHRLEVWDLAGRLLLIYLIPMLQLRTSVHGSISSWRCHWRPPRRRRCASGAKTCCSTAWQSVHRASCRHRHPRVHSVLTAASRRCQDCCTYRKENAARGSTLDADYLFALSLAQEVEEPQAQRRHPSGHALASKQNIRPPHTLH